MTTTNNKTVLDAAMSEKNVSLKKAFLKEWTPQQFKGIEKAICKHFLSDGVITRNTRYVIPHLRTTARIFHCVSDILGLAYTSSSTFAGYWVCNIEAINDKYPGYRYIGFVIDEKGKYYAILWDKDESEIIIEL